MDNPTLSLVIPCFEDARLFEDSLPRLLDFLNSKKISHEVIIVDDGSEHPQIAQDIAIKNNCRFLANGRNLGKGAAVRNGMLNARGKFLLYTDVDIPFHFDAIERFLYYLDFKEFDVVVGDRTLPESVYFKEIPRLRTIGSNFFSFIVGRFIAGGFFDTQCGLKGFRREVADDLFSIARINGFAFDIELLYISLKRNYDIKRLPVRLRSNRGSSVKLIRHGLGMLADLFRIRWYQLLRKYKRRPPDPSTRKMSSTKIPPHR